MPEPIETRSQALDFLESRINYERTIFGGRPSAESRELRAKKQPTAVSCSELFALCSPLTVGGVKLERMGRLLELLDNPQDRLPAIHVAGTKGKGSTSAMIAGMLSAAGYRTGLFTSPHVRDFEERMLVDGVQPSGAELAALADAVFGPVAEMDAQSARRQKDPRDFRKSLESDPCFSGTGPSDMRPTYFEIATAMAWLYFARQRAELVVLEVGLGGRLDATNLCRPVATVITNISRDHTQVLGNRLAQIAREKGGIIKPDVPLFSGVAGGKARAAVVEICRDRGAPLFELGREIRLSGRTVCRRETPRHSARSTSREVQRGKGTEKALNLWTFAPSRSVRGTGSAAQWVDVSTPWRSWSGVPVTLAGEHQAENAALSLSVVDLLVHRGRSVPPAAVHRGMAGVECPLRIEVLGDRPLVILDAAHNTAAAAALIRTLQSEFPAGGRRILVFAATRGKDVAGLLRELTPHFETIILTGYLNNPRGIPVEELAASLGVSCRRPALAAANPAEAWSLALKLAGADDLICVTGSFFLAAEVRELICGRPLRAGEAVSPSPLRADAPPVGSR